MVYYNRRRRLYKKKGFTKKPIRLVTRKVFAKPRLGNPRKGRSYIKQQFNRLKYKIKNEEMKYYDTSILGEAISVPSTSIGLWSTFLLNSQTQGTAANNRLGLSVINKNLFLRGYIQKSVGDIVFQTLRVMILYWKTSESSDLDPIDLFEEDTSIVSGIDVSHAANYKVLMDKYYNVSNYNPNVYISWFGDVTEKSRYGLTNEEDYVDLIDNSLWLVMGCSADSTSTEGFGPLATLELRLRYCDA